MNTRQRIVKIQATELKASEVLRRAKALIENPVRWLQGPMVTDWFGRARNLDDNKAKCFCAVGALRRTAGGLDQAERAHQLLREVVFSVGGHFYGEVGRFNDDPATTHAMVMTIFDKAIALAERPE